MRTVNGRGLLTYKGPASFDGGVKSRLELESGVDAPGTVLALLDALGYRPRFRYEKRRTPWRFADPARPLVVVDETPLGLFAEIEGEAGAVRALAAELGVREELLPPQPPTGASGPPRARRTPTSPRTWSSRNEGARPGGGLRDALPPRHPHDAEAAPPAPRRPDPRSASSATCAPRASTSAVVNAHHLAAALMAAVGDSCEGIPVAWSPEDPILGTAGAIRRAAERGLLGDAPFLVVNGDLFTTLPFAPLRAAFGAPGVVSALGVLPHAVPGETALWGDADGAPRLARQRAAVPRGDRPVALHRPPARLPGPRRADPARRLRARARRPRPLDPETGRRLRARPVPGSPRTASGSTSVPRRSSRRPRRRSRPAGLA